MFDLSQKVVYPGLGVAQVNRIIEKKVNSTSVMLYELKFIHKEMIILIPTDNSDSIGLRMLTPEEKVENIFEFLAQPAKRFKAYELTSSCWNRRSKEYQLKIMTGNLEQVAFIYRELKTLTRYKELSYGEKSMLTITESLLVEEIAAVKECPLEKTLVRIRSIFDNVSFGFGTRAVGVEKELT